MSDRYRGVSPGPSGARPQAEQRAAAHIAACTVIRQGVGALDAMLAPNQDFNVHLGALAVPNGWTVVPGVAHDSRLTLQGLGESGWAFYRAAFETPCTQPADLDCNGVVDGSDLGQVLAAWGPVQ